MIWDQKLNVFGSCLGPQILSQAGRGLLITALNYRSVQCTELQTGALFHFMVIFSYYPICAIIVVGLFLLTEHQIDGIIYCTYQGSHLWSVFWPTVVLIANSAQSYLAVPVAYMQQW